jgi:hypothetical protein
MRKVALILLIFLIALSRLVGDNIRGAVVAELDPSAESRSTTFGPGDIVAVRSNGLDAIQAAIKIELQIPEAVREYRGAYALYIYKNISPEPVTGRESFRAEEVEFLLLPASSRFTVYLPAVDGFAAEESFDISLVDGVVRAEEYPLLIAVLPVMKGIPARISRSVFEIDVSLVPSSNGTLRLEVNAPGPDDLPFAVSINGVEKGFVATGYSLPEGLHQLRITSPHFNDYTVNFTVEAGTYTDVRVELEAKASKFIAEVPEGTRIFLDGELIENPGPAGIEIEPGEHTAVFKIGDYSLSRSFSVLPGTTSTLSVDMEIEVNSR